MATHHATPGEVVNLETWAEDLATDQTKATVKTEEMEIIRLVIPAGKDIPNHKVSGPITVHCIKGRIEFTCVSLSFTLCMCMCLSVWFSVCMSLFVSVLSLGV